LVPERQKKEAQKRGDQSSLVTNSTPRDPKVLPENPAATQRRNKCKKERG